MSWLPTVRAELATQRDAAGQLQDLRTQLDQERERSMQVERLEAQLEREQERAVQASADHERAAAELQRLRVELTQEHKLAAQAEHLAAELENVRRSTVETATELADQRHRASDTQSELVRARQEIERMRIEAQTTAAALSTERSAVAALKNELTASRDALASAQEFVSGQQATARSARRWTPAAQKAISASIAAAADFRAGLKDAVTVLGSVGGWASVTAWCPGERDTVRCAAMWTESDELRAFETQTWQRSERIAQGPFGRAMAGPHSTSLTHDRFKDDRRLELAAQEGMRSALLLVPVRDGSRAIALLEFLSQEPEEPDPELAVALEAVGLQLGHFAHLLRLGTKPHWSLGPGVRLRDGKHWCRPAALRTYVRALEQPHPR